MIQPRIFSFKDVEHTIAVRQKTQIQSWPSTRTPRAVVYLSRTIANSESCQIVRTILNAYRFTVEERDLLMNSKFHSDLKRNLMVDDVTLPTVFIGGRYIGGENEVLLLEKIGEFQYPRLPMVEDGVCKVCGGYKFILFDSKDLITCTACIPTDFESDLRYKYYESSVFTDSDTKLFICLEAEDHQRRHVYMICSVKGHLLATQQTYLPTVNTESVIYGYPSMGCGVYDSKIILAGGELPSDPYRHNDCITFHMKYKHVSHEPFMTMNNGKYKPLVFQLNKRLYVCDREYQFDSIDYSKSLSIEFYCPSLKTRWRTVSSVFEQPGSSNDPLASYSCLVFGNSCLISVPCENATYITHCNYLDCDWVKHSDKSLPFTGVATFYSQDDFEDFVMIYIKNGVVRVCRFDFSCFGESQDLFTVESRTGGDLHGYFVDFGKGCFCLTAFDKSYIYAYTFVITREGKQSDPLKVTNRILTWYVFDPFSTEGRLIKSIVGCFASDPNEEANSHVEEVAATYFKNYREVNDDYDPWERVRWKV